MANLKKISVKIYKKQLFERLTQYRNSALQASMNFHHADVFLGKIVLELKSSIESESEPKPKNIDLKPNIESESEPKSKNIDLESNIEFELEFKPKKTLFEKTVSEIEFQNSVNFFAIESIDSNDVIESDVNDH